MRSISTALTAVQQIRSPQARVTCTVEARGLTPGATPWIWTQLVSNAEQSTWRVATACTKVDGATILRFKEQGSTIQMQVITDPSATTASQWTDNAWTTIVSTGASSLAALRVGSTIRLFYDDWLTGDVTYIESTDDGATWGNMVEVYGGGDSAGDVSIAYVDPAGPTTQSGWIVAFSTYAGGIYNPHFCYYESGAWVDNATTNNYRASGVNAHHVQTGQTYLDVFTHRVQDLGPSRLRHIELEDGSFANPVDIDITQAGLFGLGIGTWRLIDLNITQDITLATTVEMGDGSGAYLGIAGLLYSEEILSDEPIIFPLATTANDQSYFSLVESGADLYLLGDTLVHRATAQAATTSTLIPIRYKYDNHQLDIEFKASIDTLYVGQILVLTRALTWTNRTGNQSIRFYITRIVHGTDKVTLLALDSVGLLGTARCRRPSIINDGNADGIAQVLRRLCARFGLPATADDSALETASVMPLTLQPAESLLGAAYRITSQANAYLIPANDGSWAVSIITPGDSDVSGDYVDTAHVYPQGQAPIHNAANISDYRRYAFAYILGQYSTDPEDGSSVGMAEGPRIDNTHPLSVSLTNTRYNTQTRVETAATTEAARQETLPVTAIIHANANLSLEQYDVLSITHDTMNWTAKQFRVRKIIERWNRNRLTQEIHLGSV